MYRQFKENKISRIVREPCDCSDCGIGRTSRVLTFIRESICRRIECRDRSCRVHTFYFERPRSIIICRNDSTCRHCIIERDRELEHFDCRVLHDLIDQIILDYLLSRESRCRVRLDSFRSCIIDFQESIERLALYFVHRIYRKNTRKIHASNRDEFSRTCGLCVVASYRRFISRRCTSETISKIRVASYFVVSFVSPEKVTSKIFLIVYIESEHKKKVKKLSLDRTSETPVRICRRPGIRPVVDCEKTTIDVCKSKIDSVGCESCEKPRRVCR